MAVQEDGYIQWMQIDTGARSRVRITLLEASVSGSSITNFNQEMKFVRHIAKLFVANRHASFLDTAQQYRQEDSWELFVPEKPSVLAWLEHR